MAPEAGIAAQFAVAHPDMEVVSAVEDAMPGAWSQWFGQPRSSDTDFQLMVQPQKMGDVGERPWDFDFGVASL